MDLAAGLTRALARGGIPAVGVSIGVRADRSTWRIDYAPEATAPQRASGAALLQTYDLAADTALNDEDAAQQIDGQLMLKAVVLWVAPLVGKTPAQARTAILAIYKTLV